MNMKKIILITLVLFGLSSCATLFSGKSQNINLIPNSGSDHTEVEISNGKIVQNSRIPSVVIVPRSNQNLIIKVKENECYKASQGIHESRLNWVTAVSIFFGWFSTSSTTTDSATGALWSYDNNIIVNTQQKPECRK